MLPQLVLKGSSFSRVQGQTGSRLGFRLWEGLPCLKSDPSSLSIAKPIYIPICPMPQPGIWRGRVYVGRVASFHSLSHTVAGLDSSQRGPHLPGIQLCHLAGASCTTTEGRDEGQSHLHLVGTSRVSLVRISHMIICPGFPCLKKETEPCEPSGFTSRSKGQASEISSSSGGGGAVE